ncbi:MAG TPA: hypothetical protein VHT03_06340 [Rhizomicrobium sp.]|jgi:hypothetical protein|nr:hypothetical protein [Rhizomicrobium sp.]
MSGIVPSPAHPASKRVKAFRDELVKGIPVFPNDKATRNMLAAKSLGSLLIDYANWRIRYITPRPRKVIVEQSASSDPRWQTFTADITALLDKVARGEDLTPYLSCKIHNRGFTPATAASGPKVDRWADKDMLLIVMGYHHLHFDAAPSTTWRSDDVLFAEVTRESFTAVAIFNHDVFEPTALGTAMTAERERLWSTFNDRVTRGMPPGTVFMTPPIALSGHSVQFNFWAQTCARIIQTFDPKLDEADYVANLYQRAGVQKPPKTKFKWQLHNLDFGLLEEREPRFFLQVRGSN